MCGKALDSHLRHCQKTISTSQNCAAVAARSRTNATRLINDQYARAWQSLGHLSPAPPSGLNSTNVAQTYRFNNILVLFESAVYLLSCMKTNDTSAGDDNIVTLPPQHVERWIEHLRCICVYF
eukprot:TRINITY_DN25624_c0_g1_i1.p1 TRINITY_DN25624_c0_g1~~TRINITY_DN25624_c0_g1_i1.p1  ORF type:complete len:123 (+),score=15.50 TRINITY_DN25624_c0_g1_i1:124-492(+)